MRCPKTPFATCLSGSAKETKLRLCGIFQWEKQSLPVWIFTLLSIAVLGCGGIFGVGAKDSSEVRDIGAGFAESIISTVFGQPWLRKTFEADELVRMLHYGSVKERQIAKAVLSQAEQAFSALGLTKEEAEETYGLLSRYVMYGLEGVQEQHSLKLISVQVEDDEGCMWVYYTQEAVDARGSIVQGSWGVFSMWTIRRDANENWYVSKIKEAA